MAIMSVTQCNPDSGCQSPQGPHCVCMCVSFEYFSDVSLYWCSCQIITHKYEHFTLSSCPVKLSLSGITIISKNSQQNRVHVPVQLLNIMPSIQAHSKQHVALFFRDLITVSQGFLLRFWGDISREPNLCIFAIINSKHQTCVFGYFVFTWYIWVNPYLTYTVWLAVRHSVRNHEWPTNIPQGSTGSARTGKKIHV